MFLCVQVGEFVEARTECCHKPEVLLLIARLMRNGTERTSVTSVAFVGVHAHAVVRWMCAILVQNVHSFGDALMQFTRHRDVT